MKKEKATIAVVGIGLAAVIFGSGYLSNSTPPPKAGITESTETLTAEDSDYVKNHGTSDCAQDCSGHDAGYEWAKKKDLCDIEYDGGNSESFAEGVRAYAFDTCYYTRDGEPI